MRGKIVLPILFGIISLGLTGITDDAFAQNNGNGNSNANGGWQPAVASLQEQIDSFFDIFVDLVDFNQEIADRQAGDATLQAQIDSFFDIFTELQTDVEELKGGTEDINIGIGELQAKTTDNMMGINDNTEDIGEIQTELVALDLRGQTCPQGEVMVGVDSIGDIICIPIADVLPAPDCSLQNDCSGNGMCVADNICQCDTGFNGDDCSVPDDQCNAVNCEQCVAGEPNMCQACSSGFFMGSSGQCTERDDDFDGFTTEDDCDDDNPNVFPGAPELADGLDNDCDGEIDEGTISCGPVDQCNDSFLDPATQQCIIIPTPGAACDDGSIQTVNDVCNTVGVCTGDLASPIEIDSYPASVISFNLISLSSGAEETITLSGPSTIHANFIGVLGGVTNLDDDDAEEVQTELVSMSLTGTSSLGDITMTLNPSLASSGQIEENTNNITGLLELPPFGVGTADSFFDVFIQIDINGVELFNQSPIPIESIVTFKPVAQGETLSSTAVIQLFDESGLPTLFAIGGFEYTPNP